MIRRVGERLSLPLTGVALLILRSGNFPSERIVEQTQPFRRAYVGPPAMPELT